MRIVWRDKPDVLLLLAGQKSHRDANVSEKLQALSPSDSARVLLVEDFPDEDGPSIFDACDLLVLPSVEESFGQVFVDAWLCGKPVIGADIPQVRDVVSDGIDGWLIRPFDAYDIASKILALLAQPDVRSAFGAAGRAKATSKLSWNHLADKWESACRAIAKGN